MTFLTALKISLTGAYRTRAIGVMLVVGTILNLINQGDALLGAGALNLPKIVLTYLTPFCVATYGAASALKHSIR